MNQQGLGHEFLMGPVQPQTVAQQLIYQNISLKLNDDSPKNEEKSEVDPIKNLTDLSGDFKFWGCPERLKTTLWKKWFLSNIFELLLWVHDLKYYNRLIKFESNKKGLIFENSSQKA